MNDGGSTQPCRAPRSGVRGEWWPNINRPNAALCRWGREPQALRFQNQNIWVWERLSVSVSVSATEPATASAALAPSSHSSTSTMFDQPAAKRVRNAKKTKSQLMKEAAEADQWCPYLKEHHMTTAKGQPKENSAGLTRTRSCSSPASASCSSLDSSSRYSMRLCRG